MRQSFRFVNLVMNKSDPVKVLTSNKNWSTRIQLSIVLPAQPYSQYHRGSARQQNSANTVAPSTMTKTGHQHTSRTLLKGCQQLALNIDHDCVTNVVPIVKFLNSASDQQHVCRQAQYPINMPPAWF